MSLQLSSIFVLVDCFSTFGLFSFFHENVFLCDRLIFVQYQPGLFRACIAATPAPRPPAASWCCAKCNYRDIDKHRSIKFHKTMF